jgi:hypothetical protein
MLADQGRVYNPQQQFPVTWPDHPVVALAYLDQLQRSNTVAPADVASLRSALTAARSVVDAHRHDSALAGRIDGLLGSIKPPANPDPASQRREAALRKTLSAIVAQLR